MNDSCSWVYGFKCYEQLRVVDGISYSGLWAHGYGCFEQLSIVDDMNDLGFNKLKLLDAANSSGLKMI